MKEMLRLIEEAEKANVSTDIAKRYILDLERNGDLFSPRPGIIKIVRRENE